LAGFYLLTDDGNSWVNSGHPVVPGTAATVENSQCVLTGFDSQITPSGNSLTVRFALGFKPAFAGSNQKTAFVFAADNGGQWTQPGWLPLDSWTVQMLTDTPSPGFSPSPGSGYTNDYHIINLFATSGNGFQYVGWMELIMNWTLDPTGSCHIFYDRNQNLLYLQNDDGIGWSSGQPPGANIAAVYNHQCALDVHNTTVTPTYDTAMVNLHLWFFDSARARRTSTSCPGTTSKAITPAGSQDRLGKLGRGRSCRGRTSNRQMSPSCRPPEWE
jgi:hypothetical protein